MSENPREISRRKVSSLKFVELEEITWQGTDGKTRIWDTAERVGRLEAVMLIAKLVPSNRLILINQYRPPVNNYVLEFPAGIIDKNETPETTALRELKEETGHIGGIVNRTPLTYNTPGLTSEAVYQFCIEIDENMEENKNPQPTPDDGEHIEVVLVEFSKLNHFMNNEFMKGTLIDSKVVSYIQGIKNAAK